MLKNSALLCALLSDLSSGQYDNPPTLTPFFLFPLTKSPPYTGWLDTVDLFHAKYVSI